MYYILYSNLGGRIERIDSFGWFKNIKRIFQIDMNKVLKTRKIRTFI